MAEVHAVLAKEPDALCVTWTTDPDRDTPEVLRAYAEKYSASADRWLFLRGPQAEVLALQHHGFHVGSATDPFLHSERFILVDARGRIRGYYHALDGSGVPDLLRDFRRLRAEEGS
jgi:protein SCO1/2